MAINALGSRLLFGAAFGAVLSFGVLADDIALAVDDAGSRTTDAGAGSGSTTPAPEAATSGNPLQSIPISRLSATRDRPLFSASRRPPPPHGRGRAAAATAINGPPVGAGGGAIHAGGNHNRRARPDRDIFQRSREDHNQNTRGRPRFGLDAALAGSAFGGAGGRRENGDARYAAPGPNRGCRSRHERRPAYLWICQTPQCGPRQRQRSLRA